MKDACGYIICLGALVGCPSAPEVGSSDAGRSAESSSSSGDLSTTDPSQTTLDASTEPEPEPEPEPDIGCGNGIVEPGESCDEGQNNGDERDCTSTCVHAICGDGLLRSAPDNPADLELCDAGSDNNDNLYGGCRTDCTPGPHCGDGHIDAGYEECEPQVPGDGPECMQDCFFVGRAVFVSSAVFDGDFSSFVVEGSGLDGADEACRQVANNAQLSAADSYRAWLGSVEGSPNERITAELHDLSVPVRLVDGTIVAMDWPAFLAVPHEHPINLSEYGDHVDGFVWTGAASSGEVAEPGCSAWTSNQFTDFGRLGSTQFTDEGWTQLISDACSYNNHLYCIQTALLSEQGI